jgi:hypothetical protein
MKKERRYCGYCYLAMGGKWIIMLLTVRDSLAAGANYFDHPELRIWGNKNWQWGIGKDLVSNLSPPPFYYRRFDSFQLSVVAIGNCVGGWRGLSLSPIL